MPKFNSPALPATKPMKNPVHMGSFIRTEIIEPLGLSVTDAAAILGVGRPALSDLLNGKSDLTAKMALRIEKAFGPKMEHLMRMQLAYELAQARAHADEIKVKRYAA
jgi:addiction module HigA family antidote